MTSARATRRSRTCNGCRSTIKVDRSFVLDMLKSSSDEAIVRSTIELAHHLRLRAIADGVEDQATLDRRRALGCDLAQGFYLVCRCRTRTSVIGFPRASGAGPA
jgi:predicted signal transduction protein with EAL and GGDEF domain